MNNTRKTAIAAVLAMAMGTSAAHGSSAQPQSWFGGFTGSFTMLSPEGEIVGDDPSVNSGLMFWNYGTATGSADYLYPSQSFFGYYWSAHHITLQATAPNVVHADMLFDWGVSANIHVTADFSMPVIGSHTYALTTLDGDGDGVIGNAMDNGPFEGFNITFSGTVNVQACVENDLCEYTQVAYPLEPAVPLPPAVWLLGSGLGGLLGLGRVSKRGNIRHT